MGQALANQSRRRLTWDTERGQWFDFEKHKDSLGMKAKIFGKWDYGYTKDYQLFSSWTIWALVTLGSFSVDPLEAAGLLLGGLYAQENEEVLKLLLFKEPRWNKGSSYVHNIQGGYCWYHYFLKGNKSWPVFLGSWAEVAGDMGAVGEQYLRDENYAHDMHWKGAGLGMAVAYLLDIARTKRRKTGSAKYYLVPFAAIGAMIMADTTKNKEEQGK